MIVLVAGALAGKPGNGGNAWSRLSWTRGLGQLGIDAYFVEQLSGPTGGAVDFFEAVVGEFGERSRSVFLDERGEAIGGGLSRDALLDVAARCSLLVNLSGHLQDAELRRAARRAVYVDDDPGYTQFWYAAGLIDGRLDGHDTYYTFGTRIGTDCCPIPDCGIAWRGMRPPVVLSDWPACPGERCGRVTTVASWRGPFGPVEHAGVRYGQKVHELRKLAELPRLADRELEIALAIDPVEEPAAQRLREDGWVVVDPRPLTGDPASFRRYVQGSDAELSVAQGIYVQTSCGWFSDRTTRYLASGRPAIVQDTGFSAELPVGDGLLTFGTPREALAALRSVERDYAAHARAARALAEEHFDSARVIGRMLEEVL
ncbi:MAG TPA: hypothetical protein VFF79_18390 [Conexibacter sp.]|nr:hypothetical protein [Conexibacter sp.]